MISRMKFEGRAVDSAGVALTAVSSPRVGVDINAMPQLNQGGARFAEKIILRGRAGRTAVWLRPANFCEQDDGVGDGGVVGPHAFGSFGFDADARGLDTKQAGNALLNSEGVRGDSRRGQNQRGVNVADAVAGFVDQAQRLTKEDGGIGALPLGIAGREVSADVAAAMAPRRASVRACSRTSPSEWPARPL